MSSAMTGRPQHSHPVPGESCIQLFFSTLECLWGPLVCSLILGGLPWSRVCSLLPGLPRFFILDSDSCSDRLLKCSPKDVPSWNAQLGSAGCRDPETTVQHQPRAPSLLLPEKALDTGVPWLLPSSALCVRVLISPFPPCLLLSDPVTSSLVESDVLFSFSMV